MIRHTWVEFVLVLVSRIRTLSQLPIQWKQVLMPAKLEYRAGRRIRYELIPKLYPGLELRDSLYQRSIFADIDGFVIEF